MELLDVYDDLGNVTGRTVVRGDKSVKLNEHEHIAVAIIFIENDKGEFLIQKTSKEKGGYYSSTGGHIDSGETPLNTIKREVLEELGVNIDKDNIVEYGAILHDKTIIFLYYIKKNIDINKVKLQKEEVDYVKYMSKDEINELIENNEMLKSHGNMFKEIIKNL